MREGWQTTSLGDACTFINGLWKGEEPPFVHVGVIRNTNFTKDGTLDDTDIAYLDVEAKKFAKRRLEFGDIILEKSGGGPKQPVGRVVRFDRTQGDFSFSNFTAAIRVKDARAIDSSYLHRYLYWVYLSGRTEAMQSHSTGIRNLNSDAYKAITVPYPSLPEQRRIVAILDEAFEGIAIAKANAEKNLRNARELFSTSHEALLLDECGDRDELKLGEIASFRNGINYTKQSNGRVVPIIGVKDFKSHFWAPTHNLERIAIDGELSANDMVSEGDILCVRSNGNPELIGRCILAGALSEPVTHSGFTIRITLRNHEKSLPRYVCQFMRSRKVRRKLADGGNGLNIKSLNQRMLADISVPLPSFADQLRIVSKIEAMELATSDLAAVTQRKLSALDELTKSLLNQAFTGQLSSKATDKEISEVA